MAGIANAAGAMCYFDPVMNTVSLMLGIMLGLVVAYGIGSYYDRDAD